MNPPPDSLLDAVKSPNPRQQESVPESISSLRKTQPAPHPFLSAADEFLDQHPELLQRLSQ
ncbi:MAG: hypothetical protein EBY17_07190 [Acidobacteriia bacterium]|nr:hypothetical protein [Terriglobia bacterium]